MKTVFSYKKPYLTELPISVLLGIILLLVSGFAFAGNLNLAWNPSPSTGVAGYKLYYGTASNNYTSNIDVGVCNSTTTCTYTMTGLTDGAKYYLALKAYNAAKSIESSFSNEVSATISAATTLTADFTASQSSTSSTIVSFTPAITGIPSGTVPSYAWNFGDNTTSTASNPTKTYPAAGTYTVSLNVTAGSTSATQSKAITVTQTVAPPIANFSATTTSGTAPLTVNFSDSSTGSITNRTWNFGDGTATVTTTSTTTSHTYNVVGTYSVGLTVTGSGGSNTMTKSNYIAVSAPTATNPPPTSNSGLVAAYGFEESSGTIVTDSSGKGNHGTITEAVRIATGKFGKALQFDGVNDWVTVNDSASLDLTAGMTIEAWVNPTTTMTNWQTVVMKEQPGQQVYTLYANSDVNQPAVYAMINGGESYYTGGTQLTPGQWWHLAVTYDGQNERLYVNGILVATKAQTGDIQTSTGVLRIGGNDSWSAFFQGYIDEVRIYNRALTTQELLIDKETAVSASTPLKFIMGNTALEPWVDYQLKGRAQAFQVVPTKSGSVTQVMVYVDSSATTATKLAVGVYTNKISTANINHAGTRLAQVTTAIKPGWNPITIPLASVTAGIPYWFAILGTDGQIGFLDQTGSSTGLMERSYSSRLTSLPATWTASSTGYKTNAAMSIYGMGN